MSFIEVHSGGVIKKLLAANKKIVYVWHTPMINFDPKTCVAARPFAKAQKALCSSPRGIHDEYRQEYVKLIKSLLVEFPQIKSFDLSDLLCDKESCWASKDGEMMYRDASPHLSEDGSSYIARSLYPFLKESHSQNHIIRP